MNKIGVIGAGSWGTALAVTLSNKGHSVRIWDIDKTHIRELRENKENVRYLPGVKFCDRLVPADTVEEQCCFRLRRSISEALLNRQLPT